ncbi:MAG TPA: NADH-quinone oxidoreductase subunit M [Pyrinomonadaceae bacterium]|nr:NADH-quinone oxidoreductase subunit M [Pyrinomonadaceae bacterium]
MSEWLLTILILLPVVGGVAVALHPLAPYARTSHYKWIALIFSLATFALSLLLLNSDIGAGTTNAFHFVRNVPWVSSIGARYHVGVDGMSLWLVLLTTLLVPVSILSSWHSVEKRPAAFYAFILFLESAMIGVFVSLDLLLFYLFFEASLVPMFFLIGVWGGERRMYAAVKFFIYTAVGSLLMLAGIIWLYFLHASQVPGGGTFDYVTLLEALRSGAMSLTDGGQPTDVQFWLFVVFALAFSIKVPLFPVHTWLPDAHTEAPTAGSVILAGVLLKMGTYGLLRFNFAFFPEMTRKAAPFFVILAVIGIIYGALVAMVQPDVKRLVAYSSVSHMGFVVLGMFSFTEPGMQGALYQMLNHGVSTGALFLIVGMIYERRHTRMISDFGGLAKPMPLFATLFIFTSLSSVGLPLLNGFVGEFLIMLGMWTSTASVSRPWLVTMLAATGVIWAAVYMLWMLQRMLFGRVTSEKNARLSDLNAREIGLLVPLLVLMLYMGLHPRPFLARSATSIDEVRSRVVETGTFHADAPTELK